MGIFRAGVRVTRALTPTPSSSSSDGEEPATTKQIDLSRKLSDGKSSQLPDVEEEGQADDSPADLFLVEDTTCELPEELFSLPDLECILSLEVWNDCLTEEERESLCEYLPDMNEDTFRRTLKELLTGQNFNFSSPLHDLWQNLNDGMYNPGVYSAHQALLILQKKEHYYDVRRYHNGMVNTFLEMRNLWSAAPPASLEQRLHSWHVWRSRSSSGVKVVSRQPASSKSRRGKREKSSESVWKADQEHAHFEHELVQDNLGAKRGLKQGLFADEEQGGIYVKPDSDAMQLMRSTKKRSSNMGLRREHRVKETLRGIQSKFKSPRDGIVNKLHKSRQRSMEMALYDYGLTPSQDYGMLHDGDGGPLMEKNERAYEIEESSPSSLLRDSSSDEQSQDLWDQGASLVPPSALEFSFSLLHFISAVRTAFSGTIVPGSGESEDAPPGISFSEIVSRVHACPGDRNVLEVQMPLDCLVRGVLKVLSASIRKPAVKGFEPFVTYDRVSRRWSWVQPLPAEVPSFDEANIQFLAESWSTLPTTLYEIQDAFAKWLKMSERTLQQLWQLSLLPRPEFPFVPDEKDRFKDLKAQKSHNTINLSTPEMRSLFREEEAVRYSTTEFAFSYTTADGRKSAVAPLTRIAAKSNARARDHFMLKPDRPSHITILCLVRDATARLPQGIGTRADVCILLRDSQFIVEDVSDVQLSQVVSGALDRLHYEKDPCIRYDTEKKLWLYLHADRNEEDFEEGGTASKRSSRRGKKDGADVASLPSQAQGANEEVSEPEAGAEPDPELDSGSYNCSNGFGGGSASPELLYTNQEGGMMPEVASGQSRDEVLLPFIDLPPSMQPFCGNMQSHPMGWEVYKSGGNQLSIRQ